MTYDPAMLWAVIIVGAIGTLALKASFLVLVGRVDEIPDTVERVLRFVPAAVLAALVFPAVVAVDTTAADGLLALPAISYSPKIPAAVVAALVAWKTENVPATIAAGMIVLWVLEAL